MEPSRLPEEIAELDTVREYFDKRAVDNRAEYVNDPGADKPRLEVPDWLVEQYRDEEPDVDPIYLREGKEAWVEKVNNYLYNIHGYHIHIDAGTSNKYPFDYIGNYIGPKQKQVLFTDQEWDSENDEYIGTLKGLSREEIRNVESARKEKFHDKYQKLAKCIDSGLNNTYHEFGKFVSGTLMHLKNIMKSHGVPDKIMSEMEKKYSDKVEKEVAFKTDGRYIYKDPNVYKKELGDKFPHLVPKDTTVHETNPLIEPFMEVLSKLGENELPKELKRSAERAGVSAIVGDTITKIGTFLDEASITLEPWGLKEEIRKDKLLLLAEFGSL